MISTVRATYFIVKRLNTHRFTYFPRWSLSSLILHTISPYIVLKSCWSHAKHSSIPLWTLPWSQFARLDINSSMCSAFKSTEKSMNMSLRNTSKVSHFPIFIPVNRRHFQTPHFGRRREGKTPNSELLSSRHFVCCYSPAMFDGIELGSRPPIYKPGLVL